MNRVQNPPPPPIGPNADRDAIANLHAALLFLIERGHFQLSDEMQNKLRVDRDHTVYGDGTMQTIIAFRQQFGLGPGEIVDEPTAGALNRALEELGAFEQSDQLLVEGKVASRISASVGDLRVVIVDKAVGGDVQLAEIRTDNGGAYRATFSDSAVRQRGKTQPDLQARVFVDNTFLGASEVRYNASHQ